MTLFMFAYVAGALAVASPCMLPILPFVLAGARGRFGSGALQMLLGFALAFAVTANLEAFPGVWAVHANQHARVVALAFDMLFGLAMALPVRARKISQIRLATSRFSGLAPDKKDDTDGSPGGSLLLGIASGLVWAPCAGPILRLLLTEATLRGPSLGVGMLILTYGLGAATLLAGGILLVKRLHAVVPWPGRWRCGLRRLLGVAVAVGAGAIAFGLDTDLLAQSPFAKTESLEKDIMGILCRQPVLGIGTTANADSDGGWWGPRGALFGARQWLNTQPLHTDSVRGKVVLVNFWTYSCINCLRVLPYVRAWASKYHDRGLEVIGVHTPEFAFEKDLANVKKALVALGVDYPVATDNDFEIWRAFGNQAWPGLYFIGADGRVHGQTFGEGGYDRSERLIQQLLSEAGAPPGANDIAAVGGGGIEARADWADLRSLETYVGYAQAENFASADGIRRNDVPRLYASASPLPLNEWSLAGLWTIGSEFATSDTPSDRISFRFHARDAHLVMARSPGSSPIRFRVKLDGLSPGADHGVDVDNEGRGTLEDDRLYQLIRQTRTVTDRTLEIEFLDAGARAYDFTFG